MPAVLEDHLNKFLYQVMHSKLRLVVLTDPRQRMKYAGLDPNNFSSLHQQVRRICHDLVAKMKVLTSDIKNLN